MSAFEAGEQFGRMAGQLVIMLLLVAGFAKCVSLSRTAGANAKGFYALGTVLATWGITSSVQLVATSLGWPYGLALISILASCSLITVAIVLAIISLSEISQNPQEFTRGKKQAIWALVLSVVFILIAGGGFVAGFMKGSDRVPEAWKKPQPKERELVYSELNFKFRTPPEPWVMIDVKKLNKEGTLGFMKAKPQTMFMIIAEDLGEGHEDTLKIDGLVEVMKANLKSAAKSAKVLHDEPYKLGELEGRLVESQAQPSERLKLRYIQWAYTDGRYAYQLVTIGDVEKVTEKELKDSAETMMKNFGRIGSARSPLTDGIYSSSHFGYSLSGKMAPWEPWSKVVSEVPGADFGLQIGDKAQFAVIPVYLFKTDPDNEAVSSVLHGSLQLPEEVAKTIEVTSEDGCSVRHWNVDPWSYETRLCRQNGFAYLTYEKLNETAPDIKQLRVHPEELMSFSNVETKVGSWSEPVSLFHTEIFQKLGQAAMDQGQLDKGLAYLKIAFEIRGTSEQILEQIIDTYIQHGRKAEAQAYLDPYIEKFASNSRLRSYYVLLHR